MGQAPAAVERSSSGRPARGPGRGFAGSLAVVALGAPRVAHCARVRLARPLALARGLAPILEPRLLALELAPRLDALRIAFGPHRAVGLVRVPAVGEAAARG